MKNKSSFMISISNLKDIKEITKDTKYLNIDITNPDYEVITYFINNPNNYLYSDTTNNINGYNYVTYDEFLNAERILEQIYVDMPNDLSDLETAKYLYISIGKRLSSSINLDIKKNETYNIPLMTNVNNIWGSLSSGITNSLSCSKLYYYACRRLNIDCDIIKNEENTSSLVKLKINNQVLITNLYRDIPYIESNMQTRYFANYNDEFELDKKIKYIKKAYNDYYIDKSLKNIDYTKEDCIWQVLSKTEKILNISSINPTELSIIYRYIFDKYCPNYNIKINNLLLNNHSKLHFILISYDTSYYSYNYNKKAFVKINELDIINNLQIGKIGLYKEENIPNITNYLECIN